MNVLLVRPKSLNIIANVNVINLEPLDLEYLYTVSIEEKVNCRIFDALLDKRKLQDVLSEFKPDMVAISGYITQEQVMLDYCKTVKEYNPYVKVMVGGVHAEVNYARFYADTIDYIVHTSSLEPFRRILRLGTDFHENLLKEIAGICYREGSEWIVNKKLPVNPDELPIPDRAHFNANKHLYRYLGYSPCAIVKTAFSCPYQCSFCFCRKINDGKYAARDINIVVDEIEGIECDNVHIVDDTFLVNIERVNRFIELIKERNIKKNFIFYSRADFIVENEAIVEELGAIGTRGIIVGLEAIDDTTLDAYSKHSSENLNKACVSILQKYNMDCLGLFIINMDAVKEDFDKLYNWIKGANLRYASVSIFTPIPGTKLYEEYKDKLTTDRMQYWDFLHLVLEPTNMSRKAFYLEYYKLFLKLTLLGRKSGIYDFVDMQYIRNIAKEYFINLMKD
jgi:hopanoid C-3 methylase